jgi:hypothetical protein
MGASWCDEGRLKVRALLQDDFIFATTIAKLGPVPLRVQNAPRP